METAKTNISTSGLPLPVMCKTIKTDGAKVTIYFKENSNPGALFLLKKNLISSIIRQLNEIQ